MVKVAVIVPVSPYEPPELVRRSMEVLKKLKYPGEVRILYVLDRYDRKIDVEGVEILHRENTRGKRAGAINDGIDHFKDFNPDYIAIFDVDSIPEEDFVVKCVEALERNDKAYIASSPRFISNPVNLCSETVEAEYHLINYLLKKSRFRQFNGLIGVLRAKHLYEHRLDESAITEDADFATRMHALGYEAVLVETRVFEQAPVRWKDLFSQRRRWYYGGLQLWKHFNFVRKADFGFKLHWILSLTLTYIIAIFIPFLILSPFLLYYKFKDIKKIKLCAGLLIHTLILQVAAILAIYDYLRRRGVEWKPQKRTT
ncbi:hypothetical protein Asulf_00815 [Archaeoglobus sulfaticallidus PM70-1]|uniref:Glycosyltransferase 2-like domain-containing protein n=1 Tax=Archaeoglobus sulfaticallidus PM70-1 TaxID=387631 RepID=N0BB40_9EURY|nr:glycosyltransferase family 2 protein [Archaeoglobus sulfaticallidus]AGK60824.1 hypothetical protein Asulf_00815 [Archaeoglobus sulfaticallidus PM70-1]